MSEGFCHKDEFDELLAVIGNPSMVRLLRPSSMNPLARSHWLIICWYHVETEGIMEVGLHYSHVMTLNHMLFTFPIANNTRNLGT